MRKRNSMLNFKNYLDENLYLNYHKTLNKKIFNGDIIKPEVRNKLLNIALDWEIFCKISDKNISDIILTGGNASFNYTSKSDLDLHIIIYKSKFFGDRKLIDDYFDSKKVLWSLKNNIKIYNYSVELYAQDINDNLIASSIYSLKNNVWLKKPIWSKYNFNKNEKLINLVNQYKKEIDESLKNNDSSNLILIKKKLKKLREESLKNEGEFGLGNLTFKSLRNSGYLENINKKLQSIKNNSFSLKGI